MMNIPAFCALKYDTILTAFCNIGIIILINPNKGADINNGCKV